MGEQVVGYMNERGSVTIKTEIREILEIKNKAGLVRLRDVQVVKVNDHEIDVGDLPDATCQTISKFNEDGIVRIDEEVREFLGINGKKAMLKIGEVEVEKINDGTKFGIRCSSSPIGICALHARAMAAWSRTRDIYLRIHREIKYPLSRSTATKIMRAGVLIMMVATASRHRKDAFEAADFLMDYLKSRAPFWKKERSGAGADWVAARDEDEDALRRW